MSQRGFQDPSPPTPPVEKRGKSASVLARVFQLAGARCERVAEEGVSERRTEAAMVERGDDCWS